MKIERERVRETFREYTDAYDATDEKIKLKIDHTYRVAELCERIAKAEQMEKTEVDLAWLLGMLHDVGRFEQLRRYGTFSDADPLTMRHSERIFCSVVAVCGERSDPHVCGRCGGG